MILQIAVQGYEINPDVLIIGLLVLGILGVFGGRILRGISNWLNST